VIAEGNETHGDEPGARGEGPGERRPLARGEGDLLAERRARRAAESGEAALTRRAEAAEATVQTLERHVASLQQRLLDAEDESHRMAEQLQAEKALTVEREHELRRVKQREYAEQQLRVEAEERLVSLDRESRVEIERLGARLSVSEGDARVLADRLENVQRQLAEAEQAAASERAAIRRSEQELRNRLAELESRGSEIQRGLEQERAARERSEGLLERMREGHREIEGIVGDMKIILGKVLRALETTAEPRPPLPAAASPAPSAGEGLGRGISSCEPPEATRPPEPLQPGAGEMADALAAAVERLRQRAQESLAPPPPLRVEAPVERPPHKHSMSLITRWRIRRKQRRAR
jgi:hypothetical protein